MVVVSNEVMNAKQKDVVLERLCRIRKVLRGEGATGKV
jgi:hypothetical protein